MFTSLYRRFRPEGFEGIVRQEHVVRVLTNQIETGAIGHAYLFCGPRGTGKTSVARIFARAVNCEHPVNGSPCGKCPSCLALAEGSLDVTEIDAASNNGVNEMRDLREKVQYPPVNGKYKVYIVDEVHMLTDSAFNALLKTLEEPPAHAVFILATTEPHKIPPTILSRCMRLDFKLIPEEDLEKHLVRVLDEIGKTYEPEAVAAIARAGAGSDRDMLSIAETCIAYGGELTYEGVSAVLGAADFKEICTLGEAVVNSDGGTAVGLVEKILGEGKSVGVLLRDLLQFLNRLAVAKTCSSAEKLLSLPHDLFLEVKRVADGADGKTVLRATEILAKTETDLRASASPRIALETAILRAAVPETDYDVDALLARVSKLEKEIKELSARPAASVLPAPAPAPIVSAPKAEERAEEPAFREPFPPEEEPVFDEAIFSGPPEEPAPAPRAPVKEEPIKEGPVREEPKKEQPAAEAPVSAPSSAEEAYGKFMRALRRTFKNGVLFTMCSDLETAFEGGTLVFFTDSETVFRALTREDHAKAMDEALRSVGVVSHEVRLKKAGPPRGSGLEQLKRDFKDYPVELK